MNPFVCGCASDSDGHSDCVSSRLVFIGAQQVGGLRLRRLHLEIVVSARKMIAPMVQAMSQYPEGDSLALEWTEWVRAEVQLPEAEI